MKKWVSVWLPVFLVIFLFGVEHVSAVVTNPYTVDEKSQVLFGDSTPVLTYFGLENYIQDYFGEYAHITFTYTHGRCCFASYPPSLYITASDPRATTTPTVKLFQTAYLLGPIPIPPGHETDWYLYDIQFDTTGYSIVVKEAGVTEIVNEHRIVDGLASSDWVSLVNLYPGQNSHSMAFTPVSVKSAEPPVEQHIDPVIIVPGIMGSAYKNGVLVIDPILHTYDDLIATLDENGYTPGIDLFTFPYEWRDSNVFSADLLDDKIEQVKAICDCDKVDIVAHSMGGLVARSYIQSVDYDGDVDQVIFLGTPHKGAPTDYLRWEAGKFPVTFFDTLLESFFIAESLRNGYSTIFSYIHNKPILSVQELLPVFDYIKDDNTGLLRHYPDNYPINVFLENLNNNLSNLLSSGIEITNIVGDSGENKTIENIRVIPTDHQVFWEHGEPEGFGALIGDSGLERGVGDNTVTQFGSVLNGIVNEEIIASHNRIPTVSENKIFKILTNKESETNIDNGTNISPKVLMLQLLSPIDFVITAPNGKKIGKNFSNGTEYNEIPGAFYSGFETDNEYITILDPLDGKYKVEIQGTGSGGEYEVLTSYVTDDTSVTKETSGLTAYGQITTLDMPVNNSNPESIVPEKIITSEVLLNDIIKSYELGWITDKKLKDNLVKKAKAIIKIEKKIEIIVEKLPNGKKKEKKIEKLETKIDKKAAKALLVELKGYNKDKINQQAYDIIKTDLEWLINN